MTYPCPNPDPNPMNLALEPGNPRTLTLAPNPNPNANLKPNQKVSQKAGGVLHKEEAAGVGTRAARPPVCSRNGLRTLRRHGGEASKAMKGSETGVAAAALAKAKERRRAQLQRKKTDGDLEGWDAMSDTGTKERAGRATASSSVGSRASDRLANPYPHPTQNQTLALAREP